MIYLVKGKNGAGKTFLAHRLYELGYNHSISCTTREPRENEINGYDYYFISKEEFKKKINENFFVEYQFVNGNYYGTPTINLKDGVILVSSAQNMIEKCYQQNIVTFYIDAPLELRYKRVLEREISEQEIFERFTKENTSFLNDFEACFINNGNGTDSLKQMINNINEPKVQSNRDFLYSKIKEYKPIKTNDELLAFLQFEEFLMREIFLDNKVKDNDMEKTYFRYMKRFLNYREIPFDRMTNGEYMTNLNGKRYTYKLDNFIKKGEKEVYEREIN